MISPVVKQTFVVSGALLNNMAGGCLLGFTAVLLPRLLAADSEIRIDLDQASWIASVRGFSLIVATVAFPELMQKFGRKLIHAVSILPLLLSWIVFFFANGYKVLILASLMQGITFGAFTSVVPMAIGEFSSPKLRGVFLMLQMILGSSGILFMHAVGTYMYWRTAALVAMIPSIASLAITLCWPESPHWLAARGQFDKCADSFHWLRGHDKEALEELNALVEKYKSKTCEDKNPRKISSWRIKTIEFVKSIQRRDFLMSLAAALAAVSLFDLSGRGVVVAYSVVILKEMKLSEEMAYTATIVIDALSLAGLAISCPLTRICRRRVHLLTSATLAAAFLALAALSQYLQRNATASSIYSWTTVSLLTCYVISMALGATPVPLALLGELFPLAHKGLGGSLTGFYVAIMQMVMIKTAPLVILQLGVEGQFLVYALLIASSTLLLFFVLPETKGKTLQEIEDSYNNRRRSKRIDDELTTNDKLLQE